MKNLLKNKNQRDAPPWLFSIPPKTGIASIATTQVQKTLFENYSIVTKDMNIL
jgi:hypothetical protein